MRTESILMSLIALVVGSLLILGGVVIFLGAFLGLSCAEDLCKLFQSYAWECGLGLFVVGVALLGLCAYACRYNYLHVEMGDYSLHSVVLKDLAQQQLKTLFPDQPCQCEVVVHHAKEVEIFADLPRVDLSLQPKTLRDVEKALARLLKKEARFNHPFLLHANFRDQ